VIASAVIAMLGQGGAAMRDEPTSHEPEINHSRASKCKMSVRSTNKGAIYR
jgi:hypothetical protein